MGPLKFYNLLIHFYYYKFDAWGQNEDGLESAKPGHRFDGLAVDWPHWGQVEGVVESAVSPQSGIAGHLGAEESGPETAVEMGSKWLGRPVTPEVDTADGSSAIRYLRCHPIVGA